MTDLFPQETPDLRQMIEAVEREIAMRERVYPRWVQGGRLTEAKADQEIRLMMSVRDLLSRLRNPPVDMLEAMARAHDQEDAAQRGEPSPWNFQGADSIDEEAFRDERLSAMREAVSALAKFGVGR